MTSCNVNCLLRAVIRTKSVNTAAAAAVMTIARNNRHVDDDAENEIVLWLFHRQ